MDFKSRIKELRLEKNLTQEELGKKINLTKANISKYETGRIEPNIETLHFLSDFFNVSIDYLLGKTDVRNTNHIKAEIPDELKELGVQYIALAKQFKDNEIPPEDVEKLLKVIKGFKK